MHSAYHNQCSVAQRQHTTELVFVWLNADGKKTPRTLLRDFLHFVSASKEEPHIETKT